MSILSGLSQGLLPASFRGVPFAAVATSLAGGRRLAVHLYPGKDEPWAEDLGRAPRAFRLRGFLVTDDKAYLGGPVAAQRALLLAALEKSGPGTLTHPTIGLLKVVVRGFSISEELDAARRSSVEIDFLESGARSFPSILTSSSGLLTAANLCKVALAVDGVRLIAAAVAGGDRREAVSAAASAYSQQITTMGADATALHSLAAQLPGSYGRYTSGGNAGVSGQRATTYTADTTIDDLVAVASASRAMISGAGTAVAAAIATVDLTSATEVASSITAQVQALADACADPADAIRLLEALIAFAPADAVSTSSSGRAIAAIYQRAAAAALTTVVGDYQPSSADDAAALLSSASALLDDLATAAADAGDDESYDALRAARLSIIADLRARGGSLAQITAFRLGRPLPALVLAQRFYRDASRADQLVAQVDPVSPLFMPANFQALAA